VAQTERAYRGNVTDVRTVRTLALPGPYNRIWQPFIARWDEKQLVIAFGEHLTGKVDMGNIVCSVSVDDGDAWQEPVMIFDHSVAYGPRHVAYANPVLYRPPHQDVIWCFAMRCPLYWRDSEDSELCAAYTSDGGRSWQQVELAMHYHLPLITCAGIHRVVEGERVRYLMPAHRNTSRWDPQGTMDHFVLESTSLLEWKLAGYVPQPASGKVFMHEGNIAVGESAGELKMVMRTATADGNKALEPPAAFSTMSRDGGRTWSPGEPELALHNTTSKAYYGRAANGTQVYVFSVGARGERKGLGYKIKRPGHDWSEERIFYDADVHNSYPTLLEDEPGVFLCTWDSSNSADTGRTAIRFGRLSVSS
jgi:hypothetical protein